MVYALFARRLSETKTPLNETLLEFFGHQRELRLGLGQRLHYQTLRGFRGCISRRGHLAENLSRGMFRADAQHDRCWGAGFSF